MSDIVQAQQKLQARVTDGPGKAARTQRQNAFDNAGLSPALATLVEKVAMRSHEVQGEDFAAARASGLTEDQLFELVVCAAIGQASRQHDAALSALAAVTHSVDDASRNSG